jgi:hypothetical protein
MAQNQGNMGMSWTGQWAMKVLFRIVFWDDDGGSTHLWNVCRQLFYTVVHPRRQFWTSYSPPWELETSQSYCCLCRWGETTSLNCSPQHAYYLFPRWYISVESHSKMILTRENQSTEKNLSQCNSVHHKSHTDWPRQKPRPLQSEGDD